MLSLVRSLDPGRHGQDASLDETGSARGQLPPVEHAEIDRRVGDRVRQRREELGLSQGRLSRDLGVTFAQLKKWELGENRIGAGRLYQIAQKFAVTPNYFYGLSASYQVDGEQAEPTASGPATAQERVAFGSALGRIVDPSTRNIIAELLARMNATR
jgi:transcriptional regulator with XRE-family HTH domain